MSLKSAVVIAVIAATPALAFTNGSLVPSYLCNPNADGLPKSFGQLLPFTREQTPTVGFSQNAKQNVKAPTLAKQGNQQIGNSAYILASVHDSPNSINSINQGITVKTANGGPLVAGQANKLIISSGGANVALKGAVLVGQDANGVRQGSFSDQGSTFINFPGCGKNPQGQVSGVIQQTGISATGTYNKLVYNAPDCVTGGNLTLAGLSVTGKGFGTWSQSFQVTGSKCAGGNNGGNGGNGGNDTTGGKGQNGGNGQTGGKGQTGGNGQAGGQGQTGDKGQAGENGQTGDKGPAGGDGQAEGQTGGKDQNGGQTGGKGQTGGTGQTGEKGQAGGNGQTGGNDQTGEKAQAGDKGQAGSTDQKPCDDKPAPNGQAKGTTNGGTAGKATGNDADKDTGAAGDAKPSKATQSSATAQASKPAASKPPGRYQKRPGQNGDKPC